MTPARLRLLLFAGLAGTLALAWLAPRDDGEAKPVKRQTRKTPSANVQPRPAAAPETAFAGPGRLIRTQRLPPPDPVPDLFRSHSWYVPPPPPPAAPPPKPTSPPLPFAFIGTYAEDGREIVILTRGDRVLTASVGETIDGTYRFESMSGGQATFVYLPLDMKQTLNTGMIQ